MRMHFPTHEKRQLRKVRNTVSQVLQVVNI